jgi:hypothetical protein
MSPQRCFLIVMLSLYGCPLFAQQKSIEIHSVPQGADIYWQGKKLGATPLTITAQTPDTPDFFKPGNPAFDVYIHKDFYETETVSVAYANATPASIKVVLRPLPRLPYYDGVFLSGRKLQLSNVIRASLEELARRREEIYARYGRPIQDVRFTAYFKGTRWYRENPLYSDSMLSTVDLDNVKLINDFLEVNETDKTLFSAITRQYEFRSADNKSYIRFINAKTCIVGHPNDTEHQSIVPYFFYESGDEYPFVVAGGAVYIHTDGFICHVSLDMVKKKLMYIELLEDMNWVGSYGF